MSTGTGSDFIEDDVFAMPLDDVDTDKLGGYSSPAPGKYHGQVNAWGRGMPNWDNCYWFDVEVLAGTTPKQEGRNQRIGFNDPATAEEKSRGVCKSKLIQFAIAVGLTTEAEVKAAKEDHRPLAFRWNMAVGRQLCFEVEVNEKRKAGTAVKDWAYWPIDSSKAAGIPLNKGMLAGAVTGDDPFPKDGNGKGQKPADKPTTEKKTEPEATKPAEDDFLS